MIDHCCDVNEYYLGEDEDEDEDGESQFIGPGAFHLHVDL